MILAQAPTRKADLGFWRNRRQQLLARIVQLHNEGRVVPGHTADAFAAVGQLVRHLEAANR